MSELSIRDVVGALQLAAILPNAPDLTPEVYQGLHAVFASEGVTGPVLRSAMVEVLKRETFWPSPAVILERCRLVRQAEHLRREELARLQAARAHEALPRIGLEDAPEATEAPAGYPPKQGPPRDPSRRGASGPVLDRDPEGNLWWPELPGTAAAWRRRLCYDHGLVSWRQATTIGFMRGSALPPGILDPNEVD